ncbi:unknown [Coprobacillus sp. CAG:826]|nr:unknown [Coprobacillus sp. CAG:826]
MKKKLGTFLFIISSIFSLSSCQDKKDKIIIEREENITDFIKLSSTDYGTMIRNKRSFILTYGSQCVCYTNFKDVLRNIMKNNDLRMYEMNINDLDKVVSYKEVKTYDPGLLLVQNGIIQYSFDVNKKWEKEIYASDMNKAAQSVKKNLEKYCYFNSPFYEVNKEKALEKINSKETVYIYYMRNTCSDCKLFHRYFLNDWILKGQYDPTKKIYNFDIDPYREVDEAYNETESYIEFKNTFQLSVAGNPHFGYKTGVVPTVQKYENGQLIKMAVIYNDDINMENMTVVSGYYKDAPFLNKGFEDELDYRQSTTPFYQEKFLEVIDEKK